MSESCQSAAVVSNETIVRSCAVFPARALIQNDDVVARAVAELSHVERETGWQRVERMATIIFKYFPASARHGPAAACLRQLAAHPHCPVQKTRLAEILAARHVWLEAGALPITRLTPSHAAAVANLPRAMRLGLLQRAISEGLSVRELRARVREIRSAGGERRGRPPAQVADLAATRVENAAMLLDEAAELLSSSPVPVVSPRLQRALFDARRHLERMRAPDRLPSTG